ncbi:sugar phosphate isomerase/epimerase family protein [Calycomorphotria hydatis]|uniref:Xylose isomerase-like TIM barrel n=1 Tax=Calycomorphotria hydatis TaxID=2528027 RepID=A0A517T545_9PLAN|nr:sugar phosphate isomerase/epimerase family protein [Calycomorphotria hydatis]QDT63489.1 Xylose isomerase-like TIM barrel [Calycomorphotria hydatis]
MNTSRREFLSLAAAAGMTALNPLPEGLLAEESAKPKTRFAAFTKQLQNLSFEQLAHEVNEIGLDGIEAPVRPGGHVLPERVEEELPQMAEALAKYNRDIMILTSGINSVDDPYAERVLRTAKQLGIPQFRLAYYRYDKSQPLDKTLAEVKAKLTDLSAMCGEIGIQGIYQNHSGSQFVGSTIWDIHSVVKDLPQESIGLAFDIRHAVVEAGLSWPILYRRAKERIAAIYVKDFVWDGPKVVNVPLGSGHVNSQFFNMLADDGYDGPFSLHVEYFEKVPASEATKVGRAFFHDLAKLKNWWEQANS